jgi:hypothetical protein
MGYSTRWYQSHGTAGPLPECWNLVNLMMPAKDRDGIFCSGAVRSAGRSPVRAYSEQREGTLALEQRPLR